MSPQRYKIADRKSTSECRPGCQEEEVGQPLPERPSRRAGGPLWERSPRGRRGLLQPLPGRGKSKQLRLYRETEEEGHILWAEGRGHRQGTSRQRPGSLWACRQLGRWEALASPSVPCRCSSKEQQRSPQKVRATCWKLQEQPLGPQSPVCLGPAVRPQARGPCHFLGRASGPDCVLFVKK